MYLLAEQHPCLAVLDPRLTNAFKISHLPHNVRLNPLFAKTAKKESKK